MAPEERYPCWLLLIGPLGTNFIEILIKFRTLSFKKMRLNMSFVKWRPFCPWENELIELPIFLSRKQVPRLQLWVAQRRFPCLHL